MHRRNLKRRKIFRNFSESIGLYNNKVDIMGFYEEIATYYDTMTRFHERIPDETALLKVWVERYQLRSVVDLACGTGR